MKVSTKQEKAKAWNKKLVEPNKSQPGMIQLVYKGADGKKHVGYCELTSLELEINDESVSFGELVSTLINKQSELTKENKALKTIIKDNRKEIANVQEVLKRHLPTLFK